MPNDRLRVVDDLSLLDPEQWSEVTQGEPALRLEVLRSLTEQEGKPLPTRAFLAEDARGIAAAALCREVLRPGDHSPLDALMFGRLRKLCASIRLSARPHLSFHLPLGGASAICARAGSTHDQHRWLASLLESIETHAARRGMGVAFMRVETQAPEHAVLRERGYLQVESQPTTALTVQWQDIDGYVAHLRRASAGAAQTVRSERSRARKHGVSFRRVPADDANMAALYRLARSHYVHKNGVEPVYTADFFRRLAAALGDDLLLFEARRNESRTGMVGLVRSGPTAWVTWLGFESIDRAADFTYFNLVYYALAEYSPTAGIRKLIYGNSAIDAKRRRGCEVYPCSVFYRPRSVSTRPVASLFFRVHRAWYRRKIA